MKATNTDDAINIALTLLAVAADPKATKVRLLELQDQEAKDQAAAEEATAAVDQLDHDRIVKLTDLETREGELIKKEREVAQPSTRLQVAAAAIADRQKALDERVAAFERRVAAVVGYPDTQKAG
jgi:hypothetical protein